MTKKNAKKIAWCKLPVNLMDDERIAELVGQKGVAGVGIYMVIICEIYRRSCRCLTMTQVKALKYKGATQHTIMSVINDFGLFRIDKMSHVYSAYDFLGFDDGNDITDGGNTNTIGSKSDYVPSPARDNKDKDEDKDKHHHIYAADNGSAEEHGNNDYISKIPRSSEWTESVLDKCGFGEAIKRNWDVTIEQFKQHTIANCSYGTIRSIDDAKRYFYHYITHSITGANLKTYLQQYEHNHTDTNLYKYEDTDSCVGNRQYHGMPLPDNAPPRPDNRSEWDYDNNCWTKL